MGLFARAGAWLLARGGVASTIGRWVGGAGRFVLQALGVGEVIDRAVEVGSTPVLGDAEAAQKEVNIAYAGVGLAVLVAFGLLWWLWPKSKKGR
jgi:hypothetical protein